MKTLFLLFIFISSLSAFADTITFRTDEWCPYVCDPKSDRPGFMVEVVKEIFQKKGHTVNYEVINWARAVSDVRIGKFDALIGCGMPDAQDFVFPKNPLGQMIAYYYTGQKDSWVYRGEKSLTGKRIGFINDYTYGGDVDTLIRRNKAFVRVSGENPLQRLIQMTEAKRIDGFVENPAVLDYTLSKMEKKHALRIASPNVSYSEGLYVAFSPAITNGKKYAKIFDEGVDELRRSGRFKMLLARYELTDWKK